MTGRAPDPLIGATAGGYRVLSKLSVGGMGSVYRAEHALIGRAAAIKVLLPEMSQNHDVVQRFFTEAKATTTIKHPGIVEIFDFGYLPSGQAYIVMELLEGMTLAQRIRAQGRTHEGEAAMILRSACGALAAAHAAGVVHRDLKPDNIFLVPDGESSTGVRCKLLDFGIAKLTSVGAASSATKTGAVLGTPTYMSPEQCKGSGDVDARADLYSIGCIFYEMVAGRPPFICDGAGELIGSHLFVDPESPAKHVSITRECEALIVQLLLKDPAKRPQSAREVATLLAGIAASHGRMSSSMGDLDARLVSPSASALPTALGAPTTITPMFAMTPPPTIVPAPTLRPTPVPMIVPTPIGAYPAYVPTPTTLSGAAREAQVPHRQASGRLRAGRIAAVAAVVVVVIGGVAVLAGGRDHGVAGQPASAPALAPAGNVAPAPAPALTPPPAPGIVAAPHSPSDVAPSAAAPDAGLPDAAVADAAAAAVAHPTGTPAPTPTSIPSSTPAVAPTPKHDHGAAHPHAHPTAGSDLLEPTL